MSRVTAGDSVRDVLSSISSLFECCVSGHHTCSLACSRFKHKSGLIDGGSVTGEYLLWLMEGQ